MFSKETLRKKNNNNSLKADFHERSGMIEKWVENKMTEKVSVRRKYAGDFERNGMKKGQNALIFHLSSSSSDLIRFSSSEFSCYSLPKRKPIKTLILSQEFKRDCSVLQPKIDQGARFTKTKMGDYEVRNDVKQVNNENDDGDEDAAGEQ